MTNKRQVKKNAPVLVVVLLLSIDLIFLKGVDPINPPKLWVLGIISALMLSRILAQRNVLKIFFQNNLFKVLIFLVFLFLSGLTISLVSSPVKLPSIFGETGRLLGYLNYVFLIVVVVFVSVYVVKEQIISLLKFSILLNSTLTVYAIFQHFGFDFVNWVNPYSPVILSTGNPDFASSLLAILSVLTFSYLFLDSNRYFRLFCIMLIPFNFLAIFWTGARQGIIILLLGVAVFGVILLFESYRKIAIAVSSASVLLVFLGILGTLQKGPLVALLYKDSIRDRGYNWQAAITMFRTHILSGVGIDRYGSFFTQYRSPQYPLIYGYTQTVTNAHNVLLEMFATGGIITGVGYLFLILYVAYESIRTIGMLSGLERLKIGAIFAGWIACVAQSLISIDVLSISVWTWVLGGILIGNSIHLSQIQSEQLNSTSKINSYVPYRRNTRAENLVSLFLLCGVIFLLILPMYRNESNVLSFNSAKPVEGVMTLTDYEKRANNIFNQKFLSPNYKNQIAVQLARNNVAPESIKLFKKVIKADPRLNNAYLYLAIVNENTNHISDAILLREKLYRLDPYGAANLIYLEKDYLDSNDRPNAKRVSEIIRKIAPSTEIEQNATNLLKKNQK